MMSLWLICISTCLCLSFSYHD